MTALIRAELLALRTLRSTYVVAAAAVLLAAAITWGDMGDAGSKNLDSPPELRDALVMAAGLVSALFVALFAAFSTAAEYRHQTIAQRVLASPRRGYLLAARLITYGALSALLGAVALGASYLVAEAVLPSQSVGLHLGSGDLLAIGGEVIAGSTLFGILGVAVGFLCRNQAAAITVVFGTFLAEKLVADLIGPVRDYLPYSLLNSVLDLGGAIDPAAAVLALAGVAATITSASALLLKHRDVTS